MPGGLARQEHKLASLVCATADGYFRSISVILAVRWPPRPVVCTSRGFRKPTIF